MNVKPVAFAALIALGGCATIQDKEPIVSFNTSAKAEDIRDCVNGHLSGSAGITPYKGGWMLVKHPMMNNNFAIWQLTLTPSPAGTHVEGRTLNKPDWDDDVASCLDPLPRS